uniref:Uncharacterized protein n=1 Tax=Nicotiana tabacum TaxID=4097 RepID=A0A1S4CJQ2_TOBAC
MEVKNFFKAIVLWSTIDKGFDEPPECTTLTGDAVTQLEKNRHLDYEARYYLAIKVELHVSKKYLHAKSSKEAWTILVKSYRKVTNIKKEKLQKFKSQFELARMRPTESIKESFTRIEEIANSLRTNGEILEEVKLIEKILQSLRLKFSNKKIIIEATKNLSTLELDDLEGELVTYKRSLNQENDATLEDVSQEKVDQPKEKEDIKSGGDKSIWLKFRNIREKREGTCNFCCDRDYIECKGKSNNIQIDLSKIHAIDKKDDLVAKDVRPKE